jgi:hypothetical protein
VIGFAAGAVDRMLEASSSLLGDGTSAALMKS